MAQPASTTSFSALSSRAAFWLTGASAVAIVFSIAASQILLALALVALLFSDTRLRLPPIRLPLALFMLGTLISMALSGDPLSGRPQIRKFFVFFTLLVVYSTFRELPHLRGLVLCWAGAAALAATRGLVQFAEKYREAQYAGQNFYEYYVGERIAGFMSHWMTFGGELMIASLLLAAFLFFSPFARKKLLMFALLCAIPLAASLVLGFTRSIWLATGAAGLYLLWFWRRWLLLAVPVLVVLGVWLAPGSVRSRVVSMYQPRKEVDSNQHRIVCWRTGWQMIKAHPLIGVGPEQVGVQFDRYVPSDIPRPLPTGWYGHLHDIYIHYAAERGVPTMLMLVWFLVKALFDFLGAIRKLPPGPSDAKFLLHGAVAVVLAIMIAGVFELNLGDSEVLTMFLVTVACGYAARDAMTGGASPVTANGL
jgi:putative inorganic carbon (HCO3(-)) transporter